MTTVFLKDSYGRAIRDLRVSVTDRCNFRCFYCLPHGEPPAAPKGQMLTYEEIERAVRVFASLGVDKVRLTGGEPMLRRDIESLVSKLSRLEGVGDLALTTNAFNLSERAAGLKAAGLGRVTISLDSLRPETFKRMTGVDLLGRVLEGVRAAKRVGLTPVKVNAVIVRGHNEDEVAEMAAFAREHDLVMRFIEYMPLDSGHGWSREQVVSGAEIRGRINERFLRRARLRDGHALPLRRRRAGRGRRHRARHRAFLRGLLARPPDGRRADQDLPLFEGRALSARRDARGRGRRGVGRLRPRGGDEQGAAPLHQRDLFRAARAHDEPHRRLTISDLTGTGIRP
jgi:molybdenum cofactor biosynthesis protein A